MLLLNILLLTRCNRSPHPLVTDVAKYSTNTVAYKSCNTFSGGEVGAPNSLQVHQKFSYSATCNTGPKREFSESPVRCIGNNGVIFSLNIGWIPSMHFVYTRNILKGPPQYSKRPITWRSLLYLFLRLGKLCEQVTVSTPLSPRCLRSSLPS